jgi:hypothetical protein
MLLYCAGESDAKSGLVLNANVSLGVRIAPAPDLGIRAVTPLAVTPVMPSRIAPVLPIDLEYPNPAVVVSPETEANAVKPNRSEQILKHRRNVESVTAARIDHEKYRASGSTFLEVQKRLIGLWHESLRQSQGEEGSHQQHWRAND